MPTQWKYDAMIFIAGVAQLQTATRIYPDGRTECVFASVLLARGETILP